MWQDYELPTYAEIDGVRLDFRSDFRVIIDIFAAFNDPDLTEQERIICGLQIFFVDFDLITDFKTASDIMMLFINGNNAESGNKSPELIDWEKDVSIIIPPVNRILGQEIRQLPYLHWWTFLSAFMEIGECVFNTFVGIRNKKIKGKKLEKFEQDIYRENKDKIDLKRRICSDEQALIDEILGR